MAKLWWLEDNPRYYNSSTELLAAFWPWYKQHKHEKYPNPQLFCNMRHFAEELVRALREKDNVRAVKRAQKAFDRLDTQIDRPFLSDTYCK